MLHDLLDLLVNNLIGSSCREMWDKDGPFVSQTLYDALYKCENLDPDIIPYALDDAVQCLRENGQPPERWATYIHIGV